MTNQTIKKISIIPKKILPFKVKFTKYRIFYKKYKTTTITLPKTKQTKKMNNCEKTIKL